MEQGRMALARLVSPVGLEAFFETFWERRPLFVARREPAYFADLFTLDSADEMLARADLWYPSVRVFHQGRNLWPSELTRPWVYGHETHASVIDANKIYDLYRRGATINLRGLERSSAPLLRLNTDLEQALGFPVHITAFLTPKSADNIRPHFDKVDAFILQVSGKKRWRLWRNPAPLPLATEDASGRCEARPDDADLLGDHVLTEGDTLYVPRGCIHEAVTLDTHSLHLTVGINVHRWYDVFAALVREALTRAEDDVAYRRALPPGWARSGPRADPEGRALFARMLDDFRNLLDLERGYALVDDLMLRGRYISREGQLLDMEALPALTEGTWVFRRRGVHHTLSRGPGAVVLRFHNKRVSLPEVARVAVEFAATTPSFQVRDVPGPFSEAARADLVRLLVREGFLTLRPRSSARHSGSSVPPGASQQKSVGSSGVASPTGSPPVGSQIPGSTRGHAAPAPPGPQGGHGAPPSRAGRSLLRSAGIRKG